MVKHQTQDESTFPFLYQEHHQNYIEDLPFWVDLAHWQGDPLLELGCGTGRVSIPLLETGFEVYGLDHDSNMLGLLEKNIPAKIKPKVHLIQGDFTHFQIPQEFRLIILPCNTFSTLEKANRQTALASIFQHLSPGGIFATSIPNPSGLADLESSDESEIETSFNHPLTGNPVQVSTAWERTPTNVRFIWHYDHLTPDGNIDRLTVSTQHSLASMNDYFDEFQAAGFLIQSMYGDFDLSDYTPDSPYLILVAGKREDPSRQVRTASQ